MYGTRWLGGRAMLARVLQAFESHLDMRSTRWGVTELERRPYDASAVIEGTKVARARDAYFWLRDEPEPSVTLALDDAPSIRIVGAFPPDAIEGLYRTGAALAEVFEPHLGVASSWASPGAALDALDDRRRMLRAAQLCAREYDEHGPIGLGLRTWIGQHFVPLFGAPLLEATPCARLSRTAKGYGIDLVERPWALDDLSEAVSRWRRAMDHLAPARVFATPRAGVPDYALNARCDVGGLAAYDDALDDETS